jgi:hypothetical protein
LGRFGGKAVVEDVIENVWLLESFGLKLVEK